MVIAVVWVVVVNHSIIHHKTHDIAIMKSVGAIQKKLRSHFFAVVLVIDIIGIVIGLLVGFLLYLLLFFILSVAGFDILIHIDVIFVPILIVGIIIAVFVVNGYELWKISTKNYAQIALGDIPRNTDTQFKVFIPKRPIGLRIKMALRNLTRKRKSFYRVLLTSAITLSIIVTLTTSAFIISTTSIQSIEGAQGQDALIVGHKDLVDHYIERYEEFLDTSLEFSNTENLTESMYLMNESSIDTTLTSLSYPSISYIDKRLFVYEFAKEIKGYINIYEGGTVEHYVVGSNRSAWVPVVGLELQNHTSDWKIIGSINSSENTAIVGDTLAAHLFESATDQRIRLENVTTSEFYITGIVFDSFCAGNATYVHLNALQQDFNLNDMINLAIIGVSSSADKGALIEELQTVITSIFGVDFVVVDLTPVFQSNIRALYPFVIISIIVILIETIVIIASLFYYQSGNFQERAPDFAIIKGIGGSSNLIKRIIFYEDLAILAISSCISLGISLIFNGTLLYTDAILPSIWVVLLLWILITFVIIGIVRLSMIWLYKELQKKEQEILKDFSRTK